MPHGLTLIPAWVSNYIHHKVWDGIAYPFSNFIAEVWEWKSNFISYIIIDVITYPYRRGGVILGEGCLWDSGGGGGGGGGGFAAGIHSMKQFTHNWYLPCCQCTLSCLHTKWYPYRRGGAIILLGLPNICARCWRLPEPNQQQSARN